MPRREPETRLAHKRRPTIHTLCSAREAAQVSHSRHFVVAGFNGSRLDQNCVQLAAESRKFSAKSRVDEFSTRAASYIDP